MDTLSQNGVQGDALARARRKLGLAPLDASDKTLLHRSIMPLTRQQIREILDENAETLNQTEGHERIRTQEELDARKSDSQFNDSLTTRNRVNAELAAKKTFVVNTEIELFERVVSDFGDFTSQEERARILEIAKAQLDALMQTCHCRPRADHRALASYKIKGGQKVTVDTGLNEVEFAERLENMIVRFSTTTLYPVELDVVRRHQACKSRAEQLDFLDALQNEPEYGLKARAFAVRRTWPTMLRSRFSI